jgi:alkyldihydroxyacetonephosphate synthase
MRLQQRPIYRAGTAVLFDGVFRAAEAVRIISQSGIYPANVRLLDALEAANNGFGDGKQSVVVLAFESADHPVDTSFNRGLAICRDLGGTWDMEAAKSGSGHRQGTAEAWRHAFIRMPHYTKSLVEMGIITDTFETAITWERFHAFYEAILAATNEACVEATGQNGSVSCRFTHVYPDGPAPYFSYQAKGRHDALAEQWLTIKTRSLDAVMTHGGTVTHHHAVGRDHMPWYKRQRPDLFAAALQGAKNALDPKGILNPGVLLPVKA